MALSNVSIYPQTIRNRALQIANATGTTITSVYVAGANGSIIESINVSNTDTTAYTLQFYLNDGTTNHLIGSVSVPISAGNTTAAPGVDALRSGSFPGFPVDANGNIVIYLSNGWTLEAAVTVAVTAAKFVDIVCCGADY